MSDELLRIAERCEKAAGSSESIDNAITRALNLCFSPTDMTLRYSASVDAALALVPDKWGWSVRDTGYARLISPRSQRDDKEGFAQTPALALTAAALRARASHLRMEVE